MYSQGLSFVRWLMLLNTLYVQEFAADEADSLDEVSVPGPHVPLHGGLDGGAARQRPRREQLLLAWQIDSLVNMDSLLMKASTIRRHLLRTEVLLRCSGTNWEDALCSKVMT